MVDDACTDGESGIFPGRRTVLKWQKHHSNTAALIVVGMQVQSVCVSGRWVEAMCDNLLSVFGERVYGVGRDACVVSSSLTGCGREN